MGDEGLAQRSFGKEMEMRAPGTFNGMRVIVVQPTEAWVPRTARERWLSWPWRPRQRMKPTWIDLLAGVPDNEMLVANGTIFCRPAQYQELRRHTEPELCRNIRGWPTGAAARDQRGVLNPNYYNGLSRATVARTAKEILLKNRRDLFTCERCGKKSDIPLPRHHKDRDRSNNKIDNLEVLCVSCHNKEHMSEKVRTVRGTFV